MRNIPMILILALTCAVTTVDAKDANKPNINLASLPQKIKAPDFSLKDMDGKVYTLSQYRGNAVIINFWTTWCPPCAYEMPALNRAFKKTRKMKIKIFAINIGQDEDAIFSFLGKFPVDFPLIMDKQGTIVKQWKVTALPTTYIIDKDGYIVYQAVGGRDWDHDKLLEKINALTK